MPGYQDLRNAPAWVREQMQQTYAAWDALFRELAAPPDAPQEAPEPIVREPHPEITMAQRLAVWHSDPERAREIRAAQVVEWGEDSVRVDEEDHILYP
jgi:hypothetical protein